MLHLLREKRTTLFVDFSHVRGYSDDLAETIMHLYSKVEIYLRKAIH